MAKQQTSKQAKSAAKVDSGGANNPARKGERQPRRRSPRARAGSVAALQIDEAAAATTLPETGAENNAASTTNNQRLAPAASLSEPVSQGTDAATEGPSSADRPRASTKRATLITMLERTQGASVGEIGQHLGWLPHTVRAAITGLRHAGREVTRSKDQNGQSVYRLASVETTDR
jgi:hypothetical protein